jgi:SAM-dependent methyltransferase
MHASALQNAKRFFDVYLPHLERPTVVDIGAQDVNGSLRQVCPETAKYIGVDFVSGVGVDVVLEDPYKLPFGSASVDVVVSSSCFEHSEFFWVLFLEVLRVLKPTGLFYLNVPSNGPFHRYPVDCWRFYPDSGKALERWARMNGINATMLESFVGNQGRQRWNDFVAVFLKDSAAVDNHPERIIDGMSDFVNGLKYQIGKDQIFFNPNGQVQDQRFLGWRIHKSLSRLFSTRT